MGDSRPEDLVLCFIYLRSILLYMAYYKNYSQIFTKEILRYLLHNMPFSLITRSNALQ
jgi:hypothetical protein